MNHSIYVLYHDKCYDGFGAAWSAYKKLGNNAAYIPVSYNKPPPEMPGAKMIFVVDFSYPKDVLLELSKTAEVVVLDHHKTAQKNLSELSGERNPYVQFDMNKSGALLTWEFFHPLEPVPLLIQHISDRDLWKFELDRSDLIHKALVSYPMDFEVWDKLDVEKLKEEGVTCSRLYTSLVNNICDTARLSLVDGHTVPVVNTSIAWSEIGAELLKRYPDSPFAVSFTMFETEYMWSFRSRPEFDVSVIAEKFGGGGHKNAAGSKTPLADYDKVVGKIT